MAVDQQVIAADIHQIGDQVRPKGDHRIARAALCRIDSHGQYIEDHATHDVRQYLAAMACVSSLDPQNSMI